MKINSVYPFNLLAKYEDRLVDEYIECQLHINAYDPEVVGAKENLQWWVGSKERIEMEVSFFEEEYKITFDKVKQLRNGLPRFRDMSVHCQEVYRDIMSHGE